MREMKTIAFPGDAEPREVVDAAARERISTIENAQEWITIVDTTLSEDVAYIATNTDINGNPFLCKKLVAQVIFAEQPSGNFYFSSKMDLWNGARVAAVIPQDSNNPNKEIVAELCVNDGMFATGSFGARPNTGKSTGYYMTVGTQRSTVLICENTDKILMSAAFVSNDYDLENGKKLPAGTIVRIWGLKA